MYELRIILRIVIFTWGIIFVGTEKNIKSRRHTPLLNYKHERNGTLQHNSVRNQIVEGKQFVLAD